MLESAVASHFSVHFCMKQLFQETRIVHQLIVALTQFNEEQSTDLLGGKYQSILDPMFSNVAEDLGLNKIKNKKTEIILRRFFFPLTIFQCSRTQLFRKSAV